MRLIKAKIIEIVSRLVKASGRSGETIEKIEHPQHYGFASEPEADVYGVVLAEGNRRYMIAEGDTGRPVLDSGEVALYDSNGVIIKLKAGKHIEITGCDRISAETNDGGLIDLNGQVLEVSGITDGSIETDGGCKVALDASTVTAESGGGVVLELNATKCTVTGATGIEFGDGLLQAIVNELFMTAVYNVHTHNVSGGVTLVPNMLGTPGTHSTLTTKAS